MGFSPLKKIAKCPYCKGEFGKPVVKSKGFFHRVVRMECPCGVSGPWQYSPDDKEDWAVASEGWRVIAGDLGPPPPKR